MAHRTAAKTFRIPAFISPALTAVSAFTIIGSAAGYDVYSLSTQFEFAVTALFIAGLAVAAARTSTSRLAAALISVCASLAVVGTTISLTH